MLIASPRQQYLKLTGLNVTLYVYYIYYYKMQNTVFHRKESVVC
jgi:hypothetical protein